MTMPFLSFDSFASVGTPNSAPCSPAMSRSNSVASTVSQTSHKSEPAWFSAYNGLDTTSSRKSSTVSAKTTPVSPGEEAGRGLKSFFSAEGRAERKERKRVEQKKLETTILTSRHTAAVKTRMLLEQHNMKSSTPNPPRVQGTTSSAHITAAAQEARLPHSGPPSLQATQKDHNRDLPMLTRIISGDEHDDEDEHLQRNRDDWLKKKPEMRMRSLSEGDDSGEEELTPMADGEVLDVDGTRVIGVQLDGDAYTPKPSKARRGLGAGWSNGSGTWTRH